MVGVIARDLVIARGRACVRLGTLWCAGPRVHGIFSHVRARRRRGNLVGGVRSYEKIVTLRMNRKFILECMRTEYPELVKELTRQHFGMTVVKEEGGAAHTVRGCTTVGARYSCVIHVQRCAVWIWNGETRCVFIRLYV